MNHAQLRLFYCGLLMFLCYRPLYSQVVINNSFVSQGLFYESSLWSFSVLNNFNYTKRVKIEIKVEDINRSEDVLLIYLNNIVLEQGNNMATGFDSREAIYDYAKTLSGTNFMQNRYLGSGRYRICIRIYSEGIFADEECSEINISNQISLHLNKPYDGDILNTKYPLLTWNCNGLSEPEYLVILTRLRPFSNTGEALYHNQKYLEVITKSTYYQYTPTDFELTPNETYVWKVLALENNEIQAVSEEWKFTILPEGELKSDNQSYRLIYSGFNNGQYIFQDELKIAYRNSHNYNDLDYEIIEASSGLSIKQLPAISLVPGINKLSVPVKNIRELKNDTIYYFIINDKKRKEQYKLKFEIH